MLIVVNSFPQNIKKFEVLEMSFVGVKLLNTRRRRAYLCIDDAVVNDDIDDAVVNDDVRQLTRRRQFAVCSRRQTPLKRVPVASAAARSCRLRWCRKLTLRYRRPRRR